MSPHAVLSEDRSDFLHALRWLAALVVVLGHAQMVHLSVSGRHPTPGGLWQYIGAHAHSAVMVFFVLSGFVVAYATDQKRASHAPYRLRDYFADRWSRIYSVLLPAIVLTLVIDFFGKSFFLFPAYTNPAHIPQERELLRVILNVFGLQGSWGVRAQMGSNPALWSIAYELAFYALWGVFSFRASLGNKPRLMLTMLVAVWLGVFGWKIAVYFVPWLMGVLAWRWVARGREILRSPLIVLLVVLLLMNHFINFRNMTGYEIINDMLFALCIALLLVVQVRLPAWAGPRLRAANRWMADFSYSMYAYHLPVIFFIGAGLALWPADRWGYAIECLGLVVIPVLLARVLYRVTEAKRGAYKRAFMRATRGLVR